MNKGLKKYVMENLVKDFHNNEIWSYNESLAWTIQDYLSSYEPTEEDVEYLEMIGLSELLEEDF